MTSKEFFIKSTIFDRARALTIDPAFLEFDDSNLVSEPATRFLKEEMDGLRYGVKFIHGYRFYLGRIYCIDVKSKSGQVIKIRLKSIYGIRRKKLGIKYVEIVNSLFAFYFNEMALSYVELYQHGIPFEILGVQFNADGVYLSEKDELISWNFLGTRKYRTYYTLFPETDPNNYRIFQYMDHYNAGILHSVTERILKLKFPERKDGG